MLSEEFRKAETTPYYSTFTNNLQQERLAALQPSKDIDESDGDSLAHRLSETICGFYRALLYRIGVACLPCFEIASAFNLFGLFSPKNCEDDVLLSRATSPTSAHSVHSVQLMENGEANGVSGLDKEPPILSAASTTPKDHKKAKKKPRGIHSPTGSLHNIYMDRPSSNSGSETDLRKTKPKRRPKIDLATKGRVASEVLLRNNKGLVGKWEESSNPLAKEPRSNSLTNMNRIKLKSKGDEGAK